MKLSSVLLLATGASAQVSIYTGVAKLLGSKVAEVNDLLNMYTGGSSTASAIGTEAALLAQSVTFAGSVDQIPQPLTLLKDVLSIVPPYQQVASSFKTLASELVAKKSQLAADGQRVAVSNALNQELGAAVIFGGQVAGQFQGGASVARNIFATSVIAPITSALKSARSAYN